MKKCIKIYDNNGLDINGKVYIFALEGLDYDGFGKMDLFVRYVLGIYEELSGRLYDLVNKYYWKISENKMEGWTIIGIKEINEELLKTVYHKGTKMYKGLLQEVVDFMHDEATEMEVDGWYKVNFDKDKFDKIFDYIQDYI